MSMIEIVCDRCNGTGEHSFNLRYGKVCFKCQGRRKLQVDKSAHEAAQKRKAANAKKKALQREISEQRIRETNERTRPMIEQLIQFYSVLIEQRAVAPEYHHAFVVDNAAAWLHNTHGIHTKNATDLLPYVHLIFGLDNH